MEKHSNAPGVAPVPAGTPTERPDGRAFIGGKSREFQGHKQRPSTEPPPQSEEKPEQEEKKDEEKELCPVCEEQINQGWAFCSTCGVELGRGDIAKAIGITLGEDDIAEYLFKGYLVKDVVLTHGKKATFKTLLPKEGYEIEEILNDKFKSGEATQSQVNNFYALLNLSYGWVAFDETSLGDTPEKRRDKLETTIGVHLIDIASKKWSMFNKAVTAMLEDPDAIKN